MKNNLKKIRLNLGLSQGELAIRSGISRYTVNAVENGKNPPSTETVIALVKATNTKVEKIFPDFSL